MFDKESAGGAETMKPVKDVLVVGGENKATKGDTFTDATAITNSLVKNVKHSADTLEAKANAIRKEHPAEAEHLDQVVGRLRETHAALERGAAGDKNYKTRRFGKTLGRTQDWKKAYVSLIAGQTIDYEARAKA